MTSSLCKTCDVCGTRGSVNDDFFVYTFGGCAGYGSIHDGEYILLRICSGCLDRMLGKRTPERAEDAGE